MQLGTIKAVVFGAMAVAAALVTGVAQAALQDRDLNGDSVVDAFYDTDLDITWLRDANVNGGMNWDTAVAWANGFSFAGYDDWRLPTSDTCERFNCTGSEMGHLWYVELGNSAGSMTNSGSFQNLQSERYWSGTEGGPGSCCAYRFNTDLGNQYLIGKSAEFYAMAVRPGDVPVVPEPQTILLLLSGLTALTLVRRHQSR